MPEYLPGLSTLEYWIMGGIGAAILFVSVLVHELAHSRLAKRYGVQIRQIVLFLFGGVSDISEEIKDYKKEAKMAFAGPLTSFVLAGLFGLGFLFLTTWGMNGGVVSKMAQGVLFYSALVNLVLGAFNLIPAFPSDGGRILRAMLVRTKKDYMKATETAVHVGVAISYGLIAVGFLAMFGGDFVGGLWILLLGWFMMSGAQSYLSQMQISATLGAIKLRDIMNTNVVWVSPIVRVDALISRYFAVYFKSAFPVVDGADKNKLLGMVTLKRAQDVPEHNRPTVTASDIMIPLEDLAVATSDMPADKALALMSKSKAGKIFVFDENGSLIGLVSKTDILGVEMERQELAHELKR